MTRIASLQAELDVIPDTILSPRTVVALPPSTLDPIWDEMRVVIDGVTVISRAFDPGAEIVTNFPLVLLTEGGDNLLTEAGDTLTTETAS